MVIYGLLVNREDWQLNQPVGSDYRAVMFIFQSEGQTNFWWGRKDKKKHQSLTCKDSLHRLGMGGIVCDDAESECTFSRRHLHFVRGEATAVSQFPIVAHSYGKEQDVAGLCLHAVVCEDGRHFKVRAQNHVFSQFDLLSVEGEE